MTTESNLFRHRFIRFLNDYSIVVSLGCISTAWFFLKWYGHTPNLVFLWLLGSSTWLIFTLDHLLDARHGHPENLSSRHRKHQQHARILEVLVSFITGFNLMLVWLHRHEEYVLTGLGATLFMAGYFMMVHRSAAGLRSKEIFVAAGATLGMCILPAFLEPLSLNLTHISLWILFFLIHLINVLTFSRFSLKEDIRSGSTSLATHLGFRKISKTIFNLMAITYLLTVFWIIFFRDPFELQISLMVLLMLNGFALINFRYHAFKKNDAYRFWGDALYGIPGVLMWVLG